MLYPIELQLRERGVNKRISPSNSKQNFVGLNTFAKALTRPREPSVCEPFDTDVAVANNAFGIMGLKREGA
jgi:hypothetical protein